MNFIFLFLLNKDYAISTVNDVSQNFHKQANVFIKQNKNTTWLVSFCFQNHGDVVACFIVDETYFGELNSFNSTQINRLVFDCDVLGLTSDSLLFCIVNIIIFLQ